MTFEADCEYDRPSKQAGICRTVWTVAALAAVDANRRVLEDKRTALVGVAPETRLFVPGMVDKLTAELLRRKAGAGAMFEDQIGIIGDDTHATLTVLLNSSQ